MPAQEKYLFPFKKVTKKQILETFAKTKDFTKKAMYPDLDPNHIECIEDIWLVVTVTPHNCAAFLVLQYFLIDNEKDFNNYIKNWINAVEMPASFDTLENLATVYRLRNGLGTSVP